MHSCIKIKEGLFPVVSYNHRWSDCSYQNKRMCCFPFDLSIWGFSIVKVWVAKDCLAAGSECLSAYLLIRVNCREEIELFVLRWSENPYLSICLVTRIGDDPWIDRTKFLKGEEGNRDKKSSKHSAKPEKRYRGNPSTESSKTT
ncbi:hypothetical protein CDAR_536681 [Caerostris darwini]|uniref:Uncharacterized protein n=1 Tax=Caerostris darwini TaxID=1538125 RepID=A0AAV4VJ78_9ARAC|nr:hypothetical protein CDAR_536681 [Caerostris darwini]